MEIPKPVGSTALNRSGTLLECLNRSQKNDDAPHWVPVVTQGCFQDNKVSSSCSGTDSSMTGPTINSTLLTFIEQVNIYDLQKMVLQFAIHFVPTLGYTYMVFTLNN